MIFTKDLKFQSLKKIRDYGDLTIPYSDEKLGLHLSCLALNVGKGDSLDKRSNFVASANCALYCGAS